MMKLTEKKQQNILKELRNERISHTNTGTQIYTPKQSKTM